MTLFKTSCIAVAVSLAGLGLLNQTVYADSSTNVTPMISAPYQQEKGAIDFNQLNVSLAKTTGLANINKALQQFGLRMIVPASASEDFNNNISVEIKEVVKGQLDNGVADQFNQSNYHALIVTLPEGHDATMANKSVFIVGKIPSNMTPAQGGLMNAFAYMSGRAGLAPSIAITTENGLGLTAPNADTTTAFKTAPDVGDELDHDDYQILQNDQSNHKSTPMFYNSIISSGAWWDYYYTNTTDPQGQVHFNKNDAVFSDWKANTVSWYPQSQQDAYFSINIPYAKKATNHTFQISYIGYGQGYAPDVNATFAKTFPNRPVYFADPNQTQYTPQTNEDWWSLYLNGKRQVNVLTDHGLSSANHTIQLTSGWDSPSYVTKTAQNPVLITLPSSSSDKLNHIQVNNASTAYELHDGYQYQFQINMTATKDGQPVALTQGDPDLPNLIYTFSNGTPGSYDSTFANGKLTLNFTAHCPLNANKQIQTYCPAVFSVYHEMTDSGRIYTLTNPTVTAPSTMTLGSDPAFWIDTPKDQFWDGSKTFYADFHNLERCDSSAANNSACIAKDKAIENKFKQNFMSLDKQWGGDNGGTDPMNVKLVAPTKIGESGHLALTETVIPLAKIKNTETNSRNLQYMDCNVNMYGYSVENCNEATQFANWINSTVVPLMSKSAKTPAGELIGFIANMQMDLRNQGNHINVFDMQAAYDVPADQQAIPGRCIHVQSDNDLCQVRPSTLPSYCTVNGENVCTFWAPNISDDHKDMQKLMAELHYRTGAGIIARHRSASGKYMMCVKMPTQTGASFSSWMYGYESFLQGDRSWLHLNASKRNSELDFMESSYFNPAQGDAPITPNESDFGTYGGMISNAGSAAYRDYYNVDQNNTAQDHYIWMGYDYHTGNSTAKNIAYADADTSQLKNASAIDLNKDGEANFDSVQNARSGNYVDIYVDPTVDCSSDGINDSNFMSIWNKHKAEAVHVQGESLNGKTLPHTIVGASKGLGWLPYRYSRWTVSLWNPAGLTTVGDNAPYVGWAGTPLGNYIDHQGTQTHHLEADIGYLAMQPDSTHDQRDKIENDTGATYWSNQYDDSALNIDLTPKFSCDNGTVFPLKESNNNPGSVIDNAFAHKGVAALIPSYSDKPFTVAQVASDTINVCVPNDAMADISHLQVQLKASANAKPLPLDCYSNNTSEPKQASIDMHGTGPNAYPECKFAGS